MLFLAGLAARLYERQCWTDISQQHHGIYTVNTFKVPQDEAPDVSSSATMRLSFKCRKYCDRLSWHLVQTFMSHSGRSWWCPDFCFCFWWIACEANDISTGISYTLCLLLILACQHAKLRGNIPPKHHSSLRACQRALHRAAYKSCLHGW